jgi:hypothetical protein
MKRFLIAVLLLCSVSTIAQDYSANCSVDRFTYLYAYGQPKGGGIEAGMWPQDEIIGGGFGIAVRSTQVTSTKNNIQVQETVILNTFYAKGIARYNRYLYLTGMVGIEDLTTPYLGIGARVSLPVGRGKICSCVVEPQYTTTQGFNVLAGLGFAL